MLRTCKRFRVLQNKAVVADELVQQLTRYEDGGDQLPNDNSHKMMLQTLQAQHQVL